MNQVPVKLGSFESLILGAGITGLSAGIASGSCVFESAEYPGGICCSYYAIPGKSHYCSYTLSDGKSYRFEIGGGHWIFGGDPAVLRFIRSLTPTKSYIRRSSVYFSRHNLYVPYPLQNHLGFLGKDIAVKALTEIVSAPRGVPKTMADWLEQSFGKTLVELFFAPFHQLYTAGLWTQIAPQDSFKSPVDLALVIRGAFDATPPVGYNITFIYPVEGLDALARRMAERVQVYYGRKVVQIDIRRKQVHLTDGSTIRYERLISTLPLNRMIEMTGLDVGLEPDPYTSVLVLNIGAFRGSCCPSDHWLYIPDSRSGFHRVGFYSNVDVSFLPVSSREIQDRVSIYVERAYSGSVKPSQAEIESYSQAVVHELQEWGFIGQIEVVDSTWIDVAYTWTYPGSIWRKQALEVLEEHDIYQVGRYGRWVFQGIADSLRDGLVVGSSLRGG